MATIKDLDELMSYIAQESAGLTLDQFRLKFMAELRVRHGGDRLYIAPPDTSKKAAIEQAVRTLPTDVVAERMGVSKAYTRKVLRGIIRRG